jgi:AraC-like DNA-binding protein
MTRNSFVAYRTLRSGIVRVEADLQDFAFPAHSHDHVCIGFVRHGEHDCRYGLERYAVQCGDLMLVNPGEVHDGRPSGRCGRRYSMLEIDWTTFSSICVDATARERLEFQRTVVRDPSARDALAAWLTCLDGAEGGAEREAAALLFGRLFPVAQRAPSRKVDSELAARLHLRLRDDCGSGDSLGTLAAELGASRYQLIRAFKQHVGLTPEDYRRQLRVERARHLLASRRPLADIAAAAGFADQSHMTREFRRLTGLTPGVYRRALQ